jgi:4,5-dihydroxyphthalate decarboxylase
MSKIRLTMACWGYDRTRALMEDRVAIDGVDLTYLNLGAEEIFFRMARHHEFDVSEMSLSSYVLSLFSKKPHFVAIPVFPSRMFRHSHIFVNRDSKITTPQDLAGKRVGSPEYQLTACVWIRGILQDEYGVALDGVSYFTGGLEEPMRSEKLPVSLPSNIHLQPIPPNKTLSQMLEEGEIDALYSPRAPSSFERSPGKVRRLFGNYAAEERAYYGKTKIFPIMHTVVIRKDISEKHPWVAQSLYRAFLCAQRETYREIDQMETLKYMLPWLISHVEETRSLMGEDFWPYGVEPNAHVLQTFLRYSHEQGLSKKILRPRELFAPDSFE